MSQIEKSFVSFRVFEFKLRTMSETIEFLWATVPIFVFFFENCDLDFRAKMLKFVRISMNGNVQTENDCTLKKF